MWSPRKAQVTGKGRWAFVADELDIYCLGLVGPYHILLIQYMWPQNKHRRLKLFRLERPGGVFLVLCMVHRKSEWGWWNQPAGKVTYLRLT